MSQSGAWGGGLIKEGVPFLGHLFTGLRRRVLVMLSKSSPA